ncbi:MAG: phosphate acyltransferase PlsX [Phycisphaeraceae bacterium]|nr:phosphate acyltransferase PlsX [Phycisphaerales bacterium]MCB9842354.1 phosphate acyltransferase PlsX [Phycisphaeraceae bacterium]
MRLAVDAMGGDHAPDAIVRGCIDALDILAPGDELILTGRENDIREIMRECSVPADAPIRIIHADTVVEMHESPVEAVRAKKDSSLVKMMLLGAGRLDEPAADVVISAGNTGACVSGGTMFMKRLPGVHRPGIACAIPSFHGPMVLCDVGANPEPRAIHLAQYAVMAETYAKRVLGIQRPRVAQVNIGSEEGKGTDLIREVRELLRAIPDLNYIGYIEGRDLFEGAADVVVTDGFVGNTMLKLAEGMAKSLFKAILHEILEKDPSLALQLEPILKDLFKRNDYHEYGGAPLLGVNGVCFICHGSSEARTIRSAIRSAREYVQKGVNEAIIQRIACLEPHESPQPAGGPA